MALPQECDVPRGYRENFLALKGVPVYLFAKALKVSRQGKLQERIVLLTRSQLFVAMDTGAIRRCIQTAEVSRILQCEREVVIRSTGPGAQDTWLAFENSAVADTLRDALCLLCPSPPEITTTSSIEHAQLQLAKTKGMTLRIDPLTIPLRPLMHDGLQPPPPQPHPATPLHPTGDAPRVSWDLQPPPSRRRVGSPLGRSPPASPTAPAGHSSSSTARGGGTAASEPLSPFHSGTTEGSAHTSPQAGAWGGAGGTARSFPSVASPPGGGFGGGFEPWGNPADVIRRNCESQQQQQHRSAGGRKPPSLGGSGGVVPRQTQFPRGGQQQHAVRSIGSPGRQPVWAAATETTRRQNHGGGWPKVGPLGGTAPGSPPNYAVPIPTASGADRMVAVPESAVAAVQELAGEMGESVEDIRHHRAWHGASAGWPSNQSHLKQRPRPAVGVGRWPQAPGAGRSSGGRHQRQYDSVASPQAVPHFAQFDGDTFRNGHGVQDYSVDSMVHTLSTR